MKQAHKARAARAIPCIRERRTVAGCAVLYQLYMRRGSRGWRIKVKRNGETSEIGFCGRARVAYSFFHRIIEGGVTPCSLSDIFDDFCYENAI